MSTTKQPCKENLWYIFPISSASVEIFGIFSVLLYRFIVKLHRHCQTRQQRQRQIGQGHKLQNKINETITVTLTSENSEERIIEGPAIFQNDSVLDPDVNYSNCSNYASSHVNWMIEAKDWAGEIISGQTRTGKILISLVSALSLGSLIIFFIEVNNLQGSTFEICIEWSESLTQQIDLAFNIVFLVFFFLRLIAANDKLWFWFELYSLVDVFTVPPAFMTFVFDRYWIGLRFTRAMRLMSFTDVLVFLNILKSSNKIRLCHLVTLFASLVLTAAGFIHLIELSATSDTTDQRLLLADNYRYNLSRNKTYFDYTYFMIVTMSTVGYGDIVCHTWPGKLMMVLFILGGLAIFANSIPEMIEIIGSRNRYGGIFKQEPGKQHVVLCGHITFESVSNFLADFLHKDREDVDVQIVILDTFEPNLQLQSVLKRNLNQVLFYQGSVMNSVDLARVQIQKADACLVLCDKYSMDPDAEDAANIMRVISIKNVCPYMKVIIQLMQYHNKAYLMNIPSWDWRQGDDVVCIAELKLGFLAQSCLSPGFSTMLSNLFAMRSFEKYPNLPGWISNYMKGASLEIYTEYLSPSFHNLSFTDAVLIAFNKLNLLLIAIEIKNSKSNIHPSINGTSSIAINPKPDVLIEPGIQGFFIADSADDAKRAFHYCHICHVDTEYKAIKPCKCQRNFNFQQILYNIQTNSRKRSSLCVNARQPSPSPDIQLRNRKVHYNSTLKVSNDKIHSNIRFNHQNERRFDSTGMFHWCPNQDFESVLLSDRHQLLTTVFSNHIIVCLFSDSNSPLIGLRSFVMPLRSSNYHYVELKTIIFVGSLEFLKREWRSIMNFPKIFVLNGSPLNRSNLRMINIDLCAMTVVLSTNHSTTNLDAYLADKEAILCSLNIKSMRFHDDTTSASLYDLTHDNLTINEPIPIITEITIDASVQYLDQDDEDNPDTELFLTQPFSCGRSFAISVLDSLMSTAYFNENALTLIRTLVTGGATPQLEESLAEGSGIQGAFLTPETVVNRDRCRIEIMKLNQAPFIELFSNLMNYRELFIKSFTVYGILCLGIYRMTQPEIIEPEADYFQIDSIDNNRFVFTNPPPETQLYQNDWIYCLKPFNIDLYKTTNLSTPNEGQNDLGVDLVSDTINPVLSPLKRRTTEV